MRKNRILLVDDEESILKAMKKDFELEGYEVMTASCGEAALEMNKSQQFDMIVTDLSMPGMDGIKVLAEAKKQNPDIGSIILTGYGDMTSAIEALRLGADDYLLKPCDTEELLLRTSRCLKNREAHQKVKVYEKEGNPNLGLARTELEEQRRQMVSTLSNMEPDGDTEIEKDLSHYEDMSFDTYDTY